MFNKIQEYLVSIPKLPAVEPWRESPWNNGNRHPGWGVAEIQKMSPPTTVGDAAAVLSNKGVPQFWEM